MKEKIASGSVEADADNFSATEVMSQISQQAHRLVHEQYWVLNDDLIPELGEKDIRFVRPTQWSPKAEAWLQDFFSHDLLPVLSPLGLDPAHPFPRILNKSLNFVVSLQGRDAFGRSSADWMGRNFFQRVEVAFPIEDMALRQRILKEGLDPCLSNNSKAWVLQRDGEYKRCAPTGNQRFRRAQRSLLARIK